VADLAPGPAVTVARVPSLTPGSCTYQLEYPEVAMRLGRQGIVRMLISLDEHGRVLQAKVIGKAGFGFDESAVQAVKSRCVFAPARDAFGRPMPALIEHLFYFRIGDFRHRYEMAE
jgi:TonB family protein